MGRWPSRDPIGEDGGINLHEFVRNSPMNDQDSFGLLGVLCSVELSPDESPGNPHASIEVYSKDATGASAMEAQIFAGKGQPASAKWGYMAFDYDSLVHGSASATAWGYVSTWTDYNAARVEIPAGKHIGHVQGSAQIRVTVEITGCCPNGCEVSWAALASVSPVSDRPAADVEFPDGKVSQVERAGGGGFSLNLSNTRFASFPLIWGANTWDLGRQAGRPRNTAHASFTISVLCQ